MSDSTNPNHQDDVITESGGSPVRSPGTGGLSAEDRLARECERLVDDELSGTFPASDPPSWTLGGSHVSRLRQ